MFALLLIDFHLYFGQMNLEENLQQKLLDEVPVEQNDELEYWLLMDCLKN
jgi:hypothetical protein